MPSQQRVSGLDGLRGLAVALVVLFHVFPELLPGGFLGVDVFFVLSGYLITGLLVRGFAAAGDTRAQLRAFWLGRVRRLLPELATVLVAVCVVASFAAPEFGAGLRAQVAAAAVSGTNWLLIAHGQDYFAAFAADAGHPAAPALQHLWSLAVEEQFYVVWPLVLWGLLRAGGARGAARGRSRYPGLSLLLLAAAAGSFTLMAVNADTGSSDYYNTLTHCGGLLLGAATALRLPLQRLTALDGPGRPDRRDRPGGPGGAAARAAAAASPNHPQARVLARLRAGSLIPSAQGPQPRAHPWPEPPREPQTAQWAGQQPEQGTEQRADNWAERRTAEQSDSWAGQRADNWAERRTAERADNWAGQQAGQRADKRTGQRADNWAGQVPAQGRADEAAAQESPLSARKLVLLGRCGLGGLIVLVVLSVCLRGDTSAPERGGILLASVATLPVLLAAACPSTDVARMLTWRPAVYLGVRSYGVYLWHWPLIVLLGAPASASGIQAQLLRGCVELFLPVVLAALSRRYVTLPARRLTRAQFAALGDRLLGRAARPWPPRVLAGLAAALLLPALIGLGRAPRIDPDQSALQAQIAAGSAVAAASTAGDGAGDGADSAAGLGRALIAVPPSSTLPPAGAPDPVLGHDTTAIGDSVLLAGAQALAERLPGIVIDAKVGRQAYEAPEQLSLLADEGRLRHYVIVALGTNGDFPDSLLDEIKARIGPGRVLVLVTVHMPRSWQDAVNGRLTGYAAAHPGTVLVNWNATVSPYPNLLWPDATHPRPAGAEVYADLLAYDLARAQE